MKNPHKSRLIARASMLLSERILKGPEHQVEQPAGEVFPIADLVNGIEIPTDPSRRNAQLMAAHFKRDLEVAWRAANGQTR